MIIMNKNLDKRRSYNIGCYECPIRKTSEMSTSYGFVKLEIAVEGDMPELSKDPYKDLDKWTCDWKSLWGYTDFDMVCSSSGIAIL